MSVTSEAEDQEAQDVVHFPDSITNGHNSTDRSSSSSSPHTDPHSHSSHSEDDEQDEDEEEYSSEYSSSDDTADTHPSQPPFSQHTFAPPFYGRPPTPLPPSPSLTSLLRPSRPTTPDASDDEGNSTTGGTLPHNSSSAHRTAHSGSDPVPRASPKVPTYEYYGFVLYLFSSLSFLIYLLWSYLPSPFLHALGIYYYPNRWWSVAIPSFLVMALVYIYVALALYNTEYLTLPLGSVESIVDAAANVAVVDSKGRLRRGDAKGHASGGKGSGKGHGKSNSRSKAGKRSKKGNSSGQGGTRRTAVERERERERRKDVLLPDGRLNWREVWNEGTDAVMDVPLGGVCEVLYGEFRDGGDLDGWEVDWEEEEFITRL